MRQVRWAFNFGMWEPVEGEWCKALQSVQKEEKERIQKFRYQADAKASLAGRIMLRKFLSSVSQLKAKDLILTRTERGKPVLEAGSGAGSQCGWDYNVSHSGSWTVLAASSQGAVGVDVMKTRDRRIERLEEFFRLMRRQFTASEWTNILGSGTDSQQLFSFHRHWALKESYVKAEGTGLGIDLQTLEFDTKGTPTEGTVICDTTIKINGAKDDRWKFEEMLLDEEHVVSVALQDGKNDESEAFIKLDISQILSDPDSQLRKIEKEDWILFKNSEPIKPF